MINLLHIPEGVRDIYGEECLRKNSMESAMMDVIRHYGYNDIETPTFEYFNIFNKERGTVPSCNMYKFFDKEGNTLVLRPDITPALARTAAKYYKDCVLPVRLCYRAKQFINHSGLMGKLKQTTQIGVEFYNDDSVYADVEMISLTIDTLLAGGADNFLVEIGISDFYKGLVKEANISDEQEEELKTILEQKNIFALENFVCSLNLDGDLKDVFMQLAELFGPIDVVKNLLEKNINEVSKTALKRLITIYDSLVIRGYEKYISFDLSMLSKYSYYTGIHFRAFVKGSGEPVAGGGRYDNLVKQFGFDTPAIGMAVCVDYLLMGLERTEEKFEINNKCVYIFYNEKNAVNAQKKAVEIRKSGRKCKLILDSNGEKLNKINDQISGSENVNRFTSALDIFDLDEIISFME